MTPALPGAFLREGLMMLAIAGAPMFLALLAVGLIMGILQAATQINDPAVGFIPRFTTAIVISWLLGGWMVERLAAFLAQSITRMGSP